MCLIRTPGVLSLPQVARFLGGTSASDVEVMHESGRLGPNPVEIAGELRWRVDELDAWVRAGLPNRAQWNRRVEWRLCDEAASDTTDQLRVTSAARLLVEVVSGLTLNQAKARVSKAATADKFKTNGQSRTLRRIDRDSFSSWLFEQRRKDLASFDLSDSDAAR